MALTPQGLVETVALHLGVPESRVKNYDRQLMEAGLRTKKGRGRGSAIMTMKDAAMLIIAIASTDEVSDAAATAAHLWDFSVHESSDSAALLSLVGATTLRDVKRLGPAFCKVMEYLATTNLPHWSEDFGVSPDVSLTVYLANTVPNWADMTVTKDKVEFDVEYHKKKLPGRAFLAGLQVERRVSGISIRAIAKRIAGVD
jgi:hypothetical protein